jgi:hypothetical protein
VPERLSIAGALGAQVVLGEMLGHLCLVHHRVTKSRQSDSHPPARVAVSLMSPLPSRWQSRKPRAYCDPRDSRAVKCASLKYTHSRSNSNPSWTKAECISNVLSS